MNHAHKQQAKFYRSLVATAFLTSSVFPFVLPVNAEGTAAGQTISNTATATYEDPDGETINATSNTVSITVAEVAGVTVTNSGVTGDIEPGNEIFYEFTVTNVGNDPTRFRIPDTVTVTGPGTAGTVQVSYNGGNTWIDVDDNFITDSVPADGTILVRVPITVENNANDGETIAVTLGNTPDNTQNELRDPQADDLFTVDNPDGTPGETNGEPVNGVREASATQTATVNAPASVLNGPQNQPEAVGPTDDNDDFTNRSSPVPAGLSPGDTFDPAPVTFTNTVQNTGSSPANISLLPTPPDNPNDLPDGTVVIITYEGNTKTYVWDQDAEEFLFNGSPIDEASDYITIPNVPAGTSVDYTVSVNLPDDTPLSTDIGRGFPVAITAFVDDGTPGLQDEPQNTTINRVYTGFLRLVKESRILQGDGPAVQGTDGTFSTDPKQPAPGNIIEYRITYTNISEAQVGSNNVILPASNLVILEDGTNGNNWALDNDGNGEIDTSNVLGTANATQGSVNFFSGETATTSATDQTGTTVDTDVTRYTNDVGTVQPTAQGTFIFQRRVN
jgi:hypothetical protein